MPDATARSGPAWNAIGNNPAPMHKHVESLIGRLATDPKLLSLFGKDPARLLRALLEQGLELTDVELAALAATGPEAFRSFAASLDRRLLRAAPPTSHPAKETVR